MLEYPCGQEDTEERAGLALERVPRTFRILDWLVTLSDDLLEQFQVDLDEFEKEKTKMPYVTSVERLTMTQGFEKGLQILRKLLSEQLKEKFGTLKKATKTRIQNADEKTLPRWVGLDCAIVAPAGLRRPPRFPQSCGSGKAPPLLRHPRRGLRGIVSSSKRTGSRESDQMTQAPCLSLPALKLRGL